jgi:hypothetical protein
MEYGFNIEEAKEYGVNEAILLKNLKFWVKKNAANKKHYYDGVYWTYNSINAFVELFPFWTGKQIRRIIQSLIDQGLIKKGCYNKNPYDKTSWYTVTKKGFTIRPYGQIEEAKRAAQRAQMGSRTISDKNTYENTDSMGESSLLPFQSKEFAEAWKKWVNYLRLKKNPMVPATVEGTLEEIREHGETKSIAEIKRAMQKGWKSLVFDSHGNRTLSTAPKITENRQQGHTDIEGM